MAVTPNEIVTALGEALSVKARVRLDGVGDVPHAVVVVGSGAETWVDLRTSLAAYPDEDSRYIAGAIMAFEGWTRLDLDKMLGELCTELGLCDARHAQEQLISSGPLNVEELSNAVIEIEGLDPTTFEWSARVRKLVAKYFDSDAT